MERVRLQRQIMPADRDTDVIRLYVDPDAAALDADKYEIGHTRAAKEANAISQRIQSAARGISTLHPDQIESRTAFRVEHGEQLSFGTYFNAFPASYWRRYTIVSEVRLTVRLRGEGATVIVYRSMADGRSQRVDSATVTEGGGEFSFDLSLKPFVDGGWYWYDVVAADEDAVVESAEWTAEVPADRAAARHRHHRHHHDEPPGLLRQAARPARRRRPSSTASSTRSSSWSRARTRSSTREFFPAARAGARRPAADHRAGQHRWLRRLRPRAVRRPQGRPLDVRDDARRRRRLRDREHPAGGHLRRPGRTPTIVGGHMFSIYRKTQLHCFGEMRPAVHASGGARRRASSATGTSPSRTCGRRGGCTRASTSTTTAGSCA